MSAKLVPETKYFKLRLYTNIRKDNYKLNLQSSHFKHPVWYKNCYYLIISEEYNNFKNVDYFHTVNKRKSSMKLCIIALFCLEYLGVARA